MTKSFDPVCEWFQTKIRNVKALYNNTIKCVVDHFHTEHTSDLKKHSGRARTACIKEIKKNRKRE